MTFVQSILKMKTCWIFAIPLFTYCVTVGQVSQTITFEDIPNKTCTDSPFLLNATATSGLPVTFSVGLGKVNLSGNLLSITGPGSVLITASQLGDSNYLPAPEISKSFFVDLPYNPSDFPISFTPQRNWCVGETITESLMTVNGIYYRWSDPSGSNFTSSSLVIHSATTSNSGLYNLEMFNGNCIFTNIPFQITVHPIPVPMILNIPDIIYNTHPPIAVTGTPTGGNYYGKNISNGIYTPVPQYAGLDTIRYYYEDQYKCNAVTSKIFHVISPNLDSTIVIYELISPNNDGKNDTWQIDNIEKHHNYDISVFDRWGQLLFHSTNYDNKWDGGGLPEGAYLYMVKFKYPEKTFSGGLFLSRK